MTSSRTLSARISCAVRRAPHMAMLLICMIAFATLAAQPLQAQMLDVLYEFNGPPDGIGPVAAPLRDNQGNLYVATYGGGVSDWGTVVKLDPAGNETVLHSFTGGSDGVTPVSGLTMDAKGNLYGATYWGGNANCFNGNGCGIVYELSPGSSGWAETILYVFKGGSDGAWPGNGTLVADAAGNLYGTTLYGGSRPWPNGGGVVFKLTHTTSGWNEQVIYAFPTTAGTNTPTPYGGVILDAAGNVYGTTYYGGSYGSGTVYKIDPSGTETVLHNFTAGSKDGGGPMTALVLDEAGNLYGTTSYGGDIKCAYAIGCGTIFKIDTSGAESLLHIFRGYPQDGAFPGPVVRDKQGNLYGTAGAGNSTACQDNNKPSGCGVIFALDTSGKEIILHNFVSTDGMLPTGVNLYAGSLYGTTSSGGNSSFAGVVFKWTR
jgi:uncharacterized repeat protein (TIGR03803 family)